MFNKFSSSKVIKNTSWIIAGKCVQMVITFFSGTITARYLGPSNYGMLSTATAYMSFFRPFCTLGLTAVFVKLLLSDKDNNGKYLGSGILMRCAVSILSMIAMMAVIVCVNPNDRTLQVVSFIQSFVLFFQSFELFDYWYQSRYQSSYSSIIGVIAYAISATCKIVFAVIGKSVEWFAAAVVLDYLIIAAVHMLYTVPKNNIHLSFSKSHAKMMFHSGKHFVFSNLLVASYAYLDRVMLNKMIDSAAVGLYTTAATVCSLWVFALDAYINSMRPYIVECHQTDSDLYRKKIIQLYSIVVWASIAVSAVICLFSPLIVSILYGDEYIGSVNPLRIITWYTGFSYLGIARSIWTVCENKQRYEKYFATGGVLTNFCMNIVFIKIWGIEGAAFASLVTQFVTNVIMPYVIKDTRANAIMVIKAFNPKNIFLS